MSARGLFLTEAAGETGTPLPHRKGRAVCATMRTWNGFEGAPTRASVCQTFPAARSTSTIPKRADPAVPGRATRSVVIGRSLWPMAARRERTDFGKNPAYDQHRQLLSCALSQLACGQVIPPPLRSHDHGYSVDEH